VGLSFISAPAPLTVSRVVLLGIAGPVCEEFFFRGFLQTNLMEKVRGEKKLLKLSLSYGLILTALIFGSVHILDIFLFDLSLTSGIINAAFATLLGLLLGYAYQETRSILGPVLMHCCLNVLPLVLTLIR
jgi:membrane protease YdiL (CAAX protease family)